MKDSALSIMGDIYAEICRLLPLLARAAKSAASRVRFHWNVTAVD
jgi:hypothetical protein